MEQNVKKTKVESDLNNQLTYLSTEYSYTFENAKANVKPIENCGSVGKCSCNFLKIKILWITRHFLKSVTDFMS